MNSPPPPGPARERVHTDPDVLPVTADREGAYGKALRFLSDHGARGSRSGPSTANSRSCDVGTTNEDGAGLLVRRASGSSGPNRPLCVACRGRQYPLSMARKLVVWPTFRLCPCGLGLWCCRFVLCRSVSGVCCTRLDVRRRFGVWCACFVVCCSLSGLWCAGIDVRRCRSGLQRARLDVRRRRSGVWCACFVVCCGLSDVRCTRLVVRRNLSDVYCACPRVRRSDLGGSCTGHRGFARSVLHRPILRRSLLLPALVR
jgi:hypothetical protein